MASPHTVDDEEACKLATALIHVDEQARWKRAGGKGPPPTQASIVARLEAGLGKRVSQSTISRWLGATENRYWRREIVQIHDAVQSNPALLRKAREIAFRANIAQNIRRAIPQAAGRRLLSVYPVATHRTTRSDSREETVQEVYADFATGAAGRVVELMSTGALWGVTWGRNLAAVTAQILKDPGNRPLLDKSQRFVPLCGDPFDVLPKSDSSSVLAEQLDVFVNGHPPEVLSLRNVPAYIPERSAGFTAVEIDGIKNLMLRCRAYLSIFGPDRFETRAGPKQPFSGTPLVARLDGILTSVSGEGRTFGFGSWSMIPVSSDEKEWLNCNAFDIGGVCIARSSPDREGAQLLNRIRKGWTGIEYQQLDDCAERACRNPGPNSPPGVVVLAVEEDKASTVAACLRLGLINHLICTARLAERLEQVLSG